MKINDFDSKSSEKFVYVRKKSYLCTQFCVRHKIMTPEEKARVIIDRQLEQSGWQVVDRDEYTSSAHACAVREGLMNLSGANLEADYLLFIEGKAVGVVEAKREENELGDAVKLQALNYTKNLPSWCAAWYMPLPIVLLANGKTILYYNQASDMEDFEEWGHMPSPREISKKLQINSPFAGLPMLQQQGLRACQYRAITSLEQAFRDGQQRGLIELATGAGKTFTACLIAYRMLSYTDMKHVLFLVDRNNLGKQTETAFSQFRLTENRDSFANIFGVQRLKNKNIDPSASVVISTIQRLFSVLTGQEVSDTDDNDSAINYTEDQIIRMLPSAQIPHDYFDLIIVDEAHRSIYGNWQKVLDYFDTARLIGLTATPGEDTIALFGDKPVSRYTYDESVVDGVNVGYRIYRIKTEASENGGVIHQGDQVTTVTRSTGEVLKGIQTEEQAYEKKDLNRFVVNPEQIRLVLQTYKDKVYTDMFSEPEREPNFDYLPKTLIFAQDEAHARRIVEIAREVFQPKNDKFVQQITYSMGDSDGLIRQFRNDKDFRIAVTVTLVATGTDIQPLEVVMFMRDVQSEQLYQQMRGRGCRTIGDEQLRTVTPNAKSKDLFYLVDAVGVTEHEKSYGTSHEVKEKQPTPTLKQLLEQITHGYLPNEHLQLLANRVARINNRCEEKQRNDFHDLAGEFMRNIAEDIFLILNKGTLPPFYDVNEPNAERKLLVQPLAMHPEARAKLLELNAGVLKILMPGEDQLIYSGFSVDEAKVTIDDFERYIASRRDEIEALRMIYTGQRISYEQLNELRMILYRQNVCFTITNLWEAYHTVYPEKVSVLEGSEKSALTAIIQLVRFAFKHIAELESLYQSGAKYFALWSGQLQRALSDEQIQIMRHVQDYILSNGFAEMHDIVDYDESLAANLIKIFKTKEERDESLYSLSNFLIYHRGTAA